MRIVEGVRPHAGRGRVTTLRSLAGVAAGLLVLLGVAACGSDTSEGANTTTTTESTSATGTAVTPSQAFCAALIQFQDAVDAIGGTTAAQVKTSVEKAKADFDSLRSVAGSEMAEPVAQLDQAMGTLNDALDALGSGGSVTDVVAAATDVRDALVRIQQGLDCPTGG